MATKANPRQLATVDLIRAMLESDYKAAAAAIASGADRNAQWPFMAGRATLQEIADGLRDPKMVAALKPITKGLPSYKDNSGPWKHGLLDFVIRRGWNFKRAKIGPQGIGVESETTEAVAVGLAFRRGIDDAWARSVSKSPPLHEWRVRFKEESRTNPGVLLTFLTQASGEELWKQHEKAVADETYGDPPSEAELAGRIEHEGMRWGYEFHEGMPVGRNIADVLGLLKKGADPHFLGEPSAKRVLPGEHPLDPPKFRLLMREVRRRVPKGAGWRGKLDELTKKKAWEALLRDVERQEIEMATPAATATKKKRAF
jgi:hypothetical protein